MMFYKETNFKETPIGKIPKDWEVMKLGKVCKIKRGFSYRSRDLSKNATHLRFLTINDFEKEGGLKLSAEPIYLKEDVEVSEEFFVRQNDIFIANTDMSKGFIIGAPLWIRDLTTSFVYSMDLTKLILNVDKVSSGFLFYLLSYERFRQLMKSFAQGTNVLHLNHDLVKQMQIILSPLPEQERIAEILSTIDEAIQKTNEIIAKTERLKKGLMQELLTKGIGHKEFKDSEIGRIPRDWEVVRLEKIFNLKNGQRPKILEIGKIPVYGANGIMGYTNEFLVDNDFTIVIGRVGASGEIHLGRGKIWISDNAIYSESYERSAVYPPFAYYLLKSKELSHFASKTTHPIITQTFLNHFPIQLPSPREQQKIAEVLSTIDKKLELERNEKARLETIKQGLMDLLLTGKIRVKVD